MPRIDFKVRIWNTKQILSDNPNQHNPNPNPNQHNPNPNHNDDQFDEERLLSTLNLHDGAVLTVRWSSNGEYLASGADDQKVVVWKYDE